MKYNEQMKINGFTIDNEWPSFRNEMANLLWEIFYPFEWNAIAEWIEPN